MASSMLTAEATALASAEANVDEALNTMLHSCSNDPDFAVICDFLQKFSKDLGLDLTNFKQLLDWITKTDEVSPQLREMQIKLLRKTRKTVHEKSWESALSKFCFTYSAQDAWEIERFGYKNSSPKIKLRILRELLECQFERNNKFRAKILTLSADSLRSQPIGRDRLGHAYWVTQDKDCNLRIYQEHLDEEIWQVVATNREEFVNLINRLRGSEVVLPSAEIGIVDEDTSSSSSRTYSESLQKPPPPDQKDDFQNDEQKVPKLSIKLHGKNSKDDNTKDVGKGEEELAADEDAKLIKKSVKKPEELTESDEEEFEEVEEEYEDESDDDDIDEDDEIDEIELKINNSVPKLKKDTKLLDYTKKVKPLLISQNKIVNLANTATDVDVNAAKKRTLYQMDENSPTRDENLQISSFKKSRPSLLDSKRSKNLSKFEESKEGGEVCYEKNPDEDDNLEEELEEEDIDSVAAEEDENEEKQFEDFDDDIDYDEVGEEISNPVLHVVGEGSGKECEVGNSWFNIDYELDDFGNKNIVSKVIEEKIFYVSGEGYGNECLVGNNKSEPDTSKTSIKTSAGTESDSNLASKKIEATSNFFFGKPKILKKDEMNIYSETNKLAENLVDGTNTLSENIESLKEIENTTQVNSIDELSQINGENNHKDPKKKAFTDNLSELQKSTDPQQLLSGNIDNKNLPDDEKLDCTCKQTNKMQNHPEHDSTLVLCSTTKRIHASKMSVLESLKKELRESKQKSMEKNASSTSKSNKSKLSYPVVLNRKRRLDDLTVQQTTSMRPSNSESEIEIHSENTEDLNEQVVVFEELDVGGKRLKMRPKQTYSELRKKIEAQKVAANEENTSSSSGEEESRRRRKIVLPKKHVDQTLKLEDIGKKEESIKKNTNEEHDEELPFKVGEKKSSFNSVTHLKHSVRTQTQITTAKNKPTLVEIIEKKLKKIPEIIDKGSVLTAAYETGDVRSPKKCTFPLPNKSPITKPLKKILLSQIRKECGEDEVPRKRTTSEDLVSSVSSERKVLENNISKKDDGNQMKSSERHRKRRSSEEAGKNDAAAEPDAKKEVTCGDLKDSETKSDKKNVVKEDNLLDKKESNVNEELIPELLTPVAERRSGRRGGLTTAIMEIPQSKRTRGCNKNSTKNEIFEVENNVEDKKEIVVDIKECSSPKSILEDKEKREEKKDSSETLAPKETKNEESTPQKETNIIELNKNKITKSKVQLTTISPVKGFRNRRDVDATNIIEVIDNETPVRMSRRIAQQKIREEAERRKLEEIALRTMKQELKKKKKAEKQADPTVFPPTEPSSESESDIETKRKVQKKKCPGKNGSWSSGSEEQEEPDEEDEEPLHYEIDPGSPLFKSDHEFSPESEVEDESQVVHMKRARTVRKEDAADDEPDEEEACQKCNKSDHPEWILLCDNCDKGYHCSCLSPVLFYIPEGDWYCPPCQQEQLIKALESQLKEFDDLVEQKKKEEEKKKLLAEEEKARQEEETRKQKINRKKKMKTSNGNTSDKSSSHNSKDDEDSSRSSAESVHNDKIKSSTKNHSKNFKNNDKRNHRDRRQNVTRNVRNRHQKRESESGSDLQHKSKRSSKSTSSSSSSSSSSYSESDNEPIYKLRKRRQINVSYRLNEYDDLINSALKKEMDEAAGAGNLGRGKDISTIIEADKEEKARQQQLKEGEPSQEEFLSKSNVEENPKEMEKNAVNMGVEKSEEKRETIEEDSDDEPINQKFKIKPSLKKKSRKLTTLDISSDDDDASDEDFKGSSLDEEDDEDTSISASNSDSSLEIYKRHGKSKTKRRKAARRAFRERRKDRKFVVDESDYDDVQRPKSKKKRKDDSDYTESDADDDLSELSENIDSAELCDDTTTDGSDGGWRPNKRKKAKKSSISFVQKSPKPKQLETKKTKKIEYSDDDISETEEDENDDENVGVGGGKEMGGKQPRSQPLKSCAAPAKIKGRGGSTSTKIKKKKKSSEELSASDSEDSTRRTRGRRYAYMEDFDDDSSDGGIKPGVQRPDTPPEEREKFIKRQEEIKRMLAEKNAEGAKLAATPRLTPIKTDSEKDKQSPIKSSGDSLSTVPLSVIRQAKVLDIDYLHRRGESLDDLSNDVGEVDDDFDDADLPDDLPEDMDEDTIARMVEEEEEFGAAAARELPAPDEVLRATSSIKPKIKDVDKSTLPTSLTLFQTHTPQIPVTLPSSGLQEPVRKRLPMPTMHPPLLRHQFLLHESMANAQHLLHRHSGPTTSHLLQSALSAPLTQPLDRNYPPSSPLPTHHSLVNRLTHSIPLQPTITHVLGTPRPSISNIVKSTAFIDNFGQEKSTSTRPETEIKPRGRRKKITPLRDTLQKQQAAAAVTAATATNSAMPSTSVNTKEIVSVSVPSSVIKSGQSAKGLMQTSVITTMPTSTQSISSRPAVTIPPVRGIYARPDGPRFYDTLGNRPGVLRQRGPPQVPPSLLPPHPAIRSSYGPPPPLKGSSSMAACSPTSSSIRTSIHHMPPYVGMPPNVRHSTPHLNMYSRPSMYGNPSFGPRVNLKPNIHASEYSTGSRAYSPYSFYPPPPPLTTPGQGPTTAQISQAQPQISQTSNSVIVTTTASPVSAIISSSRPTHPLLSEQSSKSDTVTQVLPINVSPSKSPSYLPQGSKLVAEPRKKLTTLQAYTAASTVKKLHLPPVGESSGSPVLHADVVDDSSSTLGISDNVSAVEQSRVEGHASEFSGLVSYFSSQHDDYNT